MENKLSLPVWHPLLARVMLILLALSYYHQRFQRNQLESLWTRCLVTVSNFFWCWSLTHAPQNLSSCNSAAAADFEEMDAKIAQSKSTFRKDDIDFNIIADYFFGLLRPSYFKEGAT